MADPWAGIGQELRNEIEDLEHQWQVDAGFPFAIQPATLAEMAKAHVVTYSDFSQYLWNKNLIPPDVRAREPWVGFGVSQDQWNSTMSSFADSWFSMTGQTLDTTPGGDRFKEITAAMLRGESPSQWMAKLQQDANMQKTYGWLKYGMNFQQFQQYKVGQRTAFGRDLSNEEALAAYKFDQPAQGRSFGASVAAHPASQQKGASSTDLTTVR